MKPLNRPMFKYGGPIKEGIMSGMKDNRQAINTVGSPLAPKDETGRGGYAAPLLIPALATAGRFLLRPLGKFAARQFAGPVSKSTPIKNLNLNLKGTPIKGGFKRNIFEPNIAGKYLMGSPEGRFIMGASGKAGAAGKKVFGAAKSLAKSPLTLGAGVYYGGGALLPDGTPDPNDPKNQKSGEGRQFTGDEAMVGDPRKPLPDSKPKTDELTKDRIQKTKERYYKLMGLDKMKKDAVYDSLIDASKIIQKEGGDLKGSIKSGSLQTQIIDAISKQLDKSAGIKRQIDAAVLKGEIEKDINKEKNQLDAEYKKAAIKKMEAADGTLLSDIRSFVDKYQTLPSGTALAGLAKTRGMDIVKIADTQEVTDWVSKNGGDEEDFIKSMIQDPENEVAPGVHVVNNALIEVGADGSVTKLF
jgi:hypothetical protein